jgi:hypothetical protein
MVNIKSSFFINHLNIIINLLSTYVESLRTSQKTQRSSIENSIQGVLYRKIMVVYFETHTEHINTLCGQSTESR